MTPEDGKKKSASYITRTDGGRGFAEGEKAVSDIFFSYASEDRGRIIPLVRALETKNWSIFWDRVIPPGKTWRQVIGAELKRCRCMIVVWSKNSVDSEWVQEEAEEGKRRNILVPVLIDDVTPPLGFGSIQAAALAHWKSGESSPAFDDLVKAIAALLGAPPASAEEKKPRQTDEEQRRAEEERKRAKEEKAARKAEEGRRQALAKQLEVERERRRQAEARARELEDKSKQESLQPRNLQDILPGSWQAEIAVAYGVALSATFRFDGQGNFDGQILNPMMGIMPVQGQWSAAGNTLTLQGQQMIAFVATPYFAVIQFSLIGPNELQGMSNAGEQVRFRKTG